MNKYTYVLIYIYMCVCVFVCECARACVCVGESVRSVNARNLEAQFDAHLNMREHITNVCKISILHDL